MTTDIAGLILAAAREIEECRTSGEHPQAAEDAARTLFSSGHHLGADYWTVASALGKCETAVRDYPHDPAGAAELLRHAGQRLAGLVRWAESVKEMEAVFT